MKKTGYNTNGYNGNPGSGAGKRKHKVDILLILAIVLLLGGLVFLLIDPIKTYLRSKKVEEIVEAVESQIMLDDVSTTFVVPKDGYEVNGEEYDFFGSDEDIEKVKEELQKTQDELPDYITLNCIAMIDIESIGVHLPVWDDATTVSLRYGVGHLPGSVLPGENGNCTILGHHMRVEGSMFNYLDRVKTGDLIKITTQGGKEYHYICDDIKTVKASELIDYVAGDITETKQITLVTCTYTDQGKMRLCVIGHIIDD